VAQIIRNPAYVGRRRDGNGVTVHQCEAVIDAATFARAGKALDSRPKRGPATEHTALLTGLLHCSDCGGPMYRIKTRQGLFYRCSADPRSGAARTSKCGNMVRLADMDRLARAVLAARLMPLTHPGFHA